MPAGNAPPAGARKPAAPLASAMPFRILNKGPEYFRRAAELGARKPSAVERLEADKAKYVKSQRVASTRQEPVRPPLPQPPLAPAVRRAALVPGRRVPVGPRRLEPGAPKPSLDLEILNNLINVCDGPFPPVESLRGAGSGWSWWGAAPCPKPGHTGAPTAAPSPAAPLAPASRGGRETTGESGTRVRPLHGLRAPARSRWGRFPLLGLRRRGGMRGRWGRPALEARGPDEHAGALERVAGPLEVVPADAVELADVVPRRVVDAVEVGEAAGVEPPAWRREWSRGHRRRGPEGLWGRPPAPAHLPRASGRTCTGSCRGRRRGC
uniref:Family with sequence similarity 110 member A n=1 Tax=Nothoprocta perdicaria TaxID=30464 RepID=A0A8C6ZCP6_NOTPE